jgi:hypothetical protein
MASSQLPDEAIEAIARARHDSHISSQQASGQAETDNPSLLPWDALPESLKQSNRRFAEGVASKVAELGGRILPLGGRQAGREPLSLPPNLIEELARQEHKRWAEDLVRDGWKPTEGAKDPHRRLHPLLVEWEELSEYEREKDRDSVRGLPTLLATAGYAIHFLKTKAWRVDVAHRGGRSVGDPGDDLARLSSRCSSTGWIVVVRHELRVHGGGSRGPESDS